jgi:hypothetical protein
MNRKLALTLTIVLATFSALAFGAPEIVHAGAAPGCTFKNNSSESVSDLQGGRVNFYLDGYTCTNGDAQFELYADTTPNTDLIDNTYINSLEILVYEDGRYYLGAWNVTSPTSGHHSYEEAWTPEVGYQCPPCTFYADTGPTASPWGVYMYPSGHEIYITPEINRTETT